MDSFNPNPYDNNEAGGTGPDPTPEIITVKVSHGLNQHQVAVPSNSTFDDLKSAIAQKIGLNNPDAHKLLFRGKEKEGDDNLQTAGVKDNTRVLLVEDAKSKSKSPEKVVEEIKVVSRGGSAVAKVREEVDKLSQQVEAMQAEIDGGTKVDEKKIIYLTEMLMRELLKLDGIEAEGEGKVQRKMEVRRIQSYVETMDIIKSSNTNISNYINGNTVSVTTQWETFDHGSENTIVSSSSVPHSAPNSRSCPNLNPVPDSSSSPSSLPDQSLTSTSVPCQFPAQTTVIYSQPSPTITHSSPSSALTSSTKVTQEWEHFD